MIGIKEISAMAGENVQPTTWEIWAVIVANGDRFEVSGKSAAEEWVKREGGKCWFTGKHEAPSIS